MCGEQHFFYMRPGPIKGSPPRVRGTVSVCQLGQQIPGITPACAGNSGFRLRQGPALGDHPRVCGEQVLSVRCCEQI